MPPIGTLAGVAPALLAADFTPISPELQLAAVSVMSVLTMGVAIWSGVKRKPPVDSDLVALKKENEALGFRVAAVEKGVADIRQHHSASGNKIYQRIDEVEATMNAGFRSVERGVGAIEGEIKQISLRLSAMEGRR